MSDYERFDQLTALMNAQRDIAERLHTEWASACKALNSFEREQSSLFRKIADGTAVSRPHQPTPTTKGD